MKPKEFDELIRHKFDQNDFAYSPGNWDKLAEHLDGRAKKRSMIMWLWMPAAGMAASVALAMGVTTLLRFGVPGNSGTNNEYTQTSKFVQQPSRDAVAMITDNSAITEQAVAPSQQKNKKNVKLYSPSTAAVSDHNTNNGIGIRLSNVITPQAGIGAAKPAAEAIGMAIVENSAPPKNATLPKAKKPPVVEKPGYNTFAEEAVAAVKPPVKFSVILSGGISQGSHNSGYAAGATVRRMLNDKVYVEGDIAFASSDNTQKTQYMSYEGGAAGGSGIPGTAAKPGTAGKLSKVESGGKTTAVAAPEGVLKTTDVSYNLYYAQITPSIGYKILKRMSIGLGPDFQKMLVDNRPAPSTVDRGNIQVAPSFDVGFMGKTEYALTNKVRAAVYYRKGINGIISLTDKYIDRDYLQFQVKCTIFNK